MNASLLHTSVTFKAVCLTGFILIMTSTTVIALITATIPIERERPEGGREREGEREGGRERGREKGREGDRV